MSELSAYDKACYVKIYKGRIFVFEVFANLFEVLA